jgi:hypothetical protein
MKNLLVIAVAAIMFLEVVVALGRVEDAVFAYPKRLVDVQVQNDTALAHAATPLPAFA